MKSSAWLLALLFLLPLACRSQETSGNATPSAKPAPIAASSKPPSRPVEPLPTPTEMDFEEDVSQRITSKNLEAELDRLEKELTSP